MRIRKQKPNFEDTVKAMRDKELCYTDEVVKVIYSNDGMHRCVILKSAYLTYVFESLEIYDEEELLYFTTDSEPAYWLSHEGIFKPVFDDLDILMRELKADPYYKAHFEN